MRHHQGPLRGRRLRAEAESIELALAAKRLAHRCHEILSQAGLVDSDPARSLSSRAEVSESARAAFAKARDDHGDELFACLDSMECELSGWFASKPWLAMAALSAGYDPLAAGHCPRATFGRLDPASPDRLRLIQRGLALGWRPDDGAFSKLKGPGDHPVGEALWLWMSGVQTESDSLAAVDAMLRSGSSFGMERIIQSVALCPAMPMIKDAVIRKASLLVAAIEAEREAKSLESHVSQGAIPSKGAAKSL